MELLCAFRKSFLAILINTLIWWYIDTNVLNPLVVVSIFLKQQSITPVPVYQVLVNAQLEHGAAGGVTKEGNGSDTTP